MIVWFSSHYGDLIVLAVLGLAVGAVVRNMLRKKKQGKSCGCGSCAGCAMAGTCHGCQE